MSRITTTRSRLNGTVAIPASKSHTIRAVAIASLSGGQSVVRSPLLSDDALSAVKCYRALGAKIDTSDPSAWKIGGTGGVVECPDEAIDVGNSGTTLRIAIGSAALADPAEPVELTGDEQIRSRPVGPLMDSLNDLGAQCHSINENGKAPVRIAGRLVGGRTSIAATTSQYLSSLLLCTPLAPKDSEIEVALLNEPGYVQMTLDWLDKQQIQYENSNFKAFRIRGGQSYRPFDEAVPADFSSATFFLCAAALFGDKVRLIGLDFSDSQPDKEVVDYLKAMGADITVGNDSVTIEGRTLKGAELDMNRTPDALPAMAVTAAFADGTTSIRNVAQARFKETDRIKCMATELKKMGIDIEELADGLIIRGGSVRPAKLHGWADHRIVMALAMAGMGLDEPCQVDTAEAMSVTFPSYVELMRSIGAQMELIME